MPVSHLHKESEGGRIYRVNREITVLTWREISILERFHRRSSGGMATLAWPCGGFLGKTCPRQAWAWHPTRYSESETALRWGIAQLNYSLPTS
jgi:hypothetical protein